MALVKALGGSLIFGVNSDAQDTTVLGTGPTVSNGVTTQASASVNIADQLTVTGGPASGTLLLNFLLAGSLDTSATDPGNSPSTASSSATFSVSGASSTTINANDQESFSQGNTTVFGKTKSFPGTMQVLLPYAGGEVGMNLVLSDLVGSGNECGVGPMTCSVDASADFSHTLDLNFIEVMNSAGAVVPGAFVTGDSGIVYNNAAPTSAVPEPATMLLLVSGLALTGARSWRRKSIR